MPDEAKPAAPAPAAPAKADPMAAVMAYIKGELSEEAHAAAKTIAGDQAALLKHLEAHLPPASLGKVHKMLGIEL